MGTVEYVVRDTAGSVRNGTFPEGDPATLYTSFSRDVSLNLSASDVTSYTRSGGDLVVAMEDGSTLILNGYFDEAATGPKNLFLSEEGALVEVFLGDAAEGLIGHSYAALDVTGKWSAYDDLVFLDLGGVEPVVAPLAAPLIGGLGPLLAGGAAIAGGALLASSTNDDAPAEATPDAEPAPAPAPTPDPEPSPEPQPEPTPTPDPAPQPDPQPDTEPVAPVPSPTPTPDPAPQPDPQPQPQPDPQPAPNIVPTVNDPDSTQMIGGTSGTTPEVSGTGAPGATVTVTVGDKTVTTPVLPDGTWTAPFTDVPTDGVHGSNVTVTDPDGVTHALTGPTIDIDTTPPPLTISSGTESTGDILNGAEHSSGATISGGSEAGAIITVAMAGVTHTTTASADGSWSVTFTSSEVQTGEYKDGMTITATDARGNASIVQDFLVVDTVAPISTVNTVEGDDVVNAVEHSDGVTISGTGEAGASLTVEFQGVTHSTTVAADGSWSVDYAASNISTGEFSDNVNVTSTDAAGNSSFTQHLVFVDTQTNVTITPGFAGPDDVINGAEASADITLTGSAEPGSTVNITLAGVTLAATVATNGDWTVTFPGGSIPGGEYDTTVTAVATDAAGNSATSTAGIRVDTVAGDVALSTQPIELDDVINAVERADGVDVSGTATPGMTVTVTLGAASQDVVSDANGNWTTTFAAADIPTGTSTLPISASITDPVGNTKTVTDSVQLDTEVTNFTHPGPVEGDDVVNAAEQADGVVLTGTVEAGSTVIVQMNGTTLPATVDPSGTWSVNFPASAVPTGTYTAPITVTATDAAGNSATITDSVRVDTESHVTVQPDQTADDVINAAEQASGVTLAGTSEPGSSVTVTLKGVKAGADVTLGATVDPNGDWSVTFPAADLPLGTYNVTAEITAIDAVGNSQTVTETFGVDTEVDTPEVTAATVAGSGLLGVFTDDTVDSYTVHQVDSSGTASIPTSTTTTFPGAGTGLSFGAPIPDGTDLVVTRTDAAGNSASTVVANDDNATFASTLGGTDMGNFDIASLNLEYNGASNLVLDEAQIKALSNTSDTLTIRGKADDTVTVTGAVKTGQTQVIDSETYDVYTLGSDGVTLMIDQDVNVII